MTKEERINQLKENLVILGDLMAHAPTDSAYRVYASRREETKAELLGLENAKT